MVWNTTQSAFYKAIDAFNNGEKIGRDLPPLPEKSCCEECGGLSSGDLPENKCENDCRECGNSQPSKPCENRCPKCPNYPNSRVCRRRNTNVLNDLFSDKDMLLIAGLILILSQQNADKKLILALVFVLLT